MTLKLKSTELLRVTHLAHGKSEVPLHLSVRAQIQFRNLLLCKANLRRPRGAPVRWRVGMGSDKG